MRISERLLEWKGRGNSVPLCRQTQSGLLTSRRAQCVRTWSASDSGTRSGLADDSSKRTFQSTPTSSKSVRSRWVSSPCDPSQMRFGLSISISIRRLRGAASAARCFSTSWTPIETADRSGWQSTEAALRVNSTNALALFTSMTTTTAWTRYSALREASSHHTDRPVRRVIRRTANPPENGGRRSARSDTKPVSGALSSPGNRQAEPTGSARSLRASRQGSDRRQ